MKLYPVNFSATYNLKPAAIVFLFVISCLASVSQGVNNSSSRSVSKVPFTSLPFNDDTDKIQFAIISDVWGGRRPGIFEDAVDKLQLLQPQFVISVGDLTDGKTYDTSVIEQQWVEFNKDIKPLGMRFYYVPGNHDIGNPVMEREWRKRMGSPYYYFVYKNTLFLCINTEDGGHGGIRDEQVEYFRKAIGDNRGVRWTFLFMHRPVWQGKDNKEEGYEKIEALLKDRNYTLFSGHHHTYVSMTKKGQKHYVLGSTGGGSDLRGEKFGEYDHVTMVTLTKGPPKIVNLKLNGIILENVVNEDTYLITQTLIDQTWLNPIPFVSEHQLEQSITAEVKLDNPADKVLNVTGNLCSQQAYEVTPCEITVQIAPRSSLTKQIVITKKDGSPMDIAQMPFIDISLNGEYNHNTTSYGIPASKKLLLSWKLLPSAISRSKKGEHLFHDLDTSGMIALTDPEYLGGKWYWSGPHDAFVRFKMTKDEKYAYVIAMVNDDQWVDDPSMQKDLVYLSIEDAHGGQNQVTASPVDRKLMIDGNGLITAKDILFRKFFTDSILLMEFRIPLSKIKKSDNSARINIGYRDQDNFPEKDVAVLYWKPLWGSAEDYKNSGTFLLK